MEKYTWSLDISTTNVGSALWDSKGKLIELKHLELKISKEIPVEFRDLHKADLFKNYCIKYKSIVENEMNGVIDSVIVEAPLQNTPKNINTTALLLGFNGISRFILYSIFGFEPVKITVHESRKLFCPELVSTRTTRKGEIKETLSFPIEYRKVKKLYVWEKVAKLEPQIEWFYTRNKTLKPMCYDMSDAYCCGYSNFVKLGILK